jgi:hypothetical protein
MVPSCSWAGLNVESFEIAMEFGAGTNAQYTDNDHC